MKILFVATVVKGHIMVFHIPYLRMCKDMGWETAVAAKNDYANPQECNIPYCDTYYDIPFDRSPFGASNIKAYKQLKEIILVGGFDIVHCHTPVGGALARFAGMKARRESGLKVVYTAHGFHFYKGAPLLNWLTFYPVERLLARVTDLLITINREDYTRALTFKFRAVGYVPGVGIDTEKYSMIGSRTRADLRARLNIPENAYVLLSVGEINVNKNHQTAIRAMAKLDNENVYYVVCGDGDLMEENRQLAESLGLAHRFIEAGFCQDVSHYYQIADAFIFPSKREGLSVALAEAMSSGLPCVVSKIRGNEELIDDELGGYQIRNDDSLEYARKIDTLFGDSALRVRMGEHNRAKVQQYSVEKVLPIVRKMYETITLDS